MIETINETAEQQLLERQKELFEKFVTLNVNELTEKKKELTYLSWAYAWQETLKIYPSATYVIKTFTNEITGVTTPYLASEIGLMVFTSLTIAGVTREMWLPVMDNANNAMKFEPYSYATKNGERTVAAATMFDVNKAIMRCLTKNIAMFGLGIYIYAGEDLPTEISEPATEEQLTQMKELKVIEKNILLRYQIKSLAELTTKQAEYIINIKRKSIEKGESNDN